MPILMYHSIRDGAAFRNAYYETNTSPLAFAQQMKYLHDHGYYTPTWETVSNGLASATSDRTGKPVVITFDDGYADFYREAFPVLQRYGFTATVFVVSGFLKPERVSFKRTECLNLSEVRELHSCGMTIGSHTVSHPELKRLSVGEVESELSGSKQALEDAVGAPITTFAYPYAFPEANRGFVRTLEGLLQECGYELGVTTILGTAKPQASRWFLPRLPVNTWDDLSFLGAKLEGAYDWLRIPQRAAKSVKGLLSREASLRMAAQTSRC